VSGGKLPTLAELGRWSGGTRLPEPGFQPEFPQDDWRWTTDGVKTRALAFRPEAVSRLRWWYRAGGTRR